MATHLIKHLPKSGLIRHNNLSSKFQTRNSSTSSTNQSTLPPRTPPPPPQPRPVESPGATLASGLGASGSSGSGGLKLAVGLSLGLSIGLLAQDTVVKRLFPTPEPKVPEKPAPSIDPVLIEQLISQDRKVNQLENQLSQLREDLRERKQQEVKQFSAPIKSNGTVFELSEVIQANNLANNARQEKLLDEQRRVLLREHLLKVEGEVLKVENKYRPIINKIRELEAHLESQRQLQQKEAPARLLWISCQSLLCKLRDYSQEPLEKDPAYEILKQFAAENNSLAISILDSIPAKALREGVQSEHKLQERFKRIERVCKLVDLVDAHGGGLGKYLLSYMQSLVILDRSEAFHDQDEVLGRKLVDPTRWTTFDILARVKYCLKENNLEQAIRYANQLKGQARVVARDWIRDARTHLTTRQAFKSLSTYAEALAVDASLNNLRATQNNTSN